MRIFAIVILLMPCVASAQVNLCLDDKGRKTYTEAGCEEIGMKPVGVIKDIKPKSKRCYDLEDQAKRQRTQAEKLKNTNDTLNTGKAMAVIVEGEANRLDQQYAKECKR